jgi:hypothetical protein
VASRTPPPAGRRALPAALLGLALAVGGWGFVSYGGAVLALRSGSCAGSPAMGALLLGWLAAVVVAFLLPLAVFLRRGRWRPALRALGIGTTALVVLYALAFAGVGAACA